MLSRSIGFPLRLLRWLQLSSTTYFKLARSRLPLFVCGVISGTKLAVAPGWPKWTSQKKKVSRPVHPQQPLSTSGTSKMSSSMNIFTRWTSRWKSDPDFGVHTLYTAQLLSSVTATRWPQLRGTLQLWLWLSRRKKTWKCASGKIFAKFLVHFFPDLRVMIRPKCC